MLHDNIHVSPVERDMQQVVRESLAASGFRIISATDVSRSGDFLHKIISLIQGCGFGIAVFSNATPPKTLANIFFEVGYCLALGKPTQLIVSGEGASPSDFVRTEWISHNGSEEAFRERLSEYLASMVQYGDYLFNLAQTAEDAEEPDLLTVYERFRRSYLVDRNQRSLDGLRRLHNKLRGRTKISEIGKAMKPTRRSLSDEIVGFLRMAVNHQG